MEKITLKFPDLHKLWEFRLEINVLTFMIDGKTRTLSCRCSNNHINRALHYYNATLISQQTAYPVKMS